MSAKRKGDTKEHPLSSSDEIRHLAGPIADHTVRFGNRCNYCRSRGRTNLCPW